MIEHFGTGTRPSAPPGLCRAVSRHAEELLALLRALGEELGRIADRARPRRAARRDALEVALLAHVRLVQRGAREAGYDVAAGAGASRACGRAGRALAAQLGRLPKFADWAEARRSDASLLTEWQVYRMFEARRGAWATFQFLIRRRLLADGEDVSADGTVALPP